MDYLDPKKKRAHKYRLLVGYGFFAVAIAFATLILVYLANGYFIDRRTGEVIQNGLVFIDSRPGNAEIYINGERQRGRTDARLVLPSGNYDFDLYREGYRPWNRSLSLDGGSLRRLTYARLVPEKLDTLSTVLLPTTPAHVGQSVDKRWIVMSYPNNTEELSLVDLNQAIPVAQTLELPDALIAEGIEGHFEIIDWADDNATVLLAYIATDGTVQYVTVDRRNPAQAQNISTLFGDAPYEINFRDRKRDQFFVFNPATQQLFTATLNNGVSTTPYINSSLLAYKIFGPDWVLYTVTGAEVGSTEMRLRRGSQDILLRTMAQADDYILQLAKLGNVPVLAFTSTEEDRVFVYYDPEKYLAENPDARVPVATTTLQVESFIDMKISADSSVVLAYGTQQIASHEFEDERTYQFGLDMPIEIEHEPRWLDGQHFSYNSGGIQYMTDYDGSNIYQLVTAEAKLGALSSQEINRLFTFTAIEPGSELVPTAPARMTITSLLTPADR